MKARVIAFYLPQFHPVEVNDKYWGKGFTEWRNVAKARPLFRGHNEPRIPADLGYYDLRMPEIREQQAALAKEAGIEGFCYWHYWFGNGKEVLERPFDEVVRSGDPDFPFCLGWANHSWTTRTWTKIKSNAEDSYIFKQEYPGEKDYMDHFYRLLPAFKDNRYITVDGKPLFLIFDLNGFNDFINFKNVWNNLAEENGLPGFYFVSHTSTVPIINRENRKELLHPDMLAENAVKLAFEKGADAVETLNLQYAELKAKGLLYKAFGVVSRNKLNGLFLEKYDYGKIVNNYQIAMASRNNVFPEILVGNDRSPRAGRKAIIYYNATPENFYLGAKKAIELVEKKDKEHRIIFLNSWNEWGEGSYMEPDTKYGKEFIYQLRRALDE
ncbi:glycoside hydrolase family 99-like domain-containing protein [Baileyella intestinalis]|uniref:glycosyltransferase WbsX family protein n=1 Tax=Baileyella intestinalis TaxID=2606709 RepID=UPI0022E5C4BF|nr:glycoside hydrolase family 99-like domain-containing protein [Baileyella intestinalis]